VGQTELGISRVSKKGEGDYERLVVSGTGFAARKSGGALHSVYLLARVSTPVSCVGYGARIDATPRGGRSFNALGLKDAVETCHAKREPRPDTFFSDIGDRSAPNLKAGRA